MDDESLQMSNHQLLNFFTSEAKNRVFYVDFEDKHTGVWFDPLVIHLPLQNFSDYQEKRSISSANKY